MPTCLARLEVVVQSGMASMYELLCDHMVEGFCVVEVLFDGKGAAHDYVIREVNPAFERQTGLTGARGKRMRDLFAGGVSPALAVYAGVAQSGKSARFEQRSEILGRWYDVQAFRCSETGAPLVGVLFSDITQRKLDELMAHSVVDYAIIMLDPEGRVRTWNAGAERIKGYKRDEVVGRDFSLFYPPDQAAAGRPAEVLARAAQEGHFDEEGWRMRKDGSRFWASVAITPLRDNEDRLQGYVKVTRDLTERQRAERLRDLSTRLIDVQEHERGLVARHMHDDLGQILSVLRMQLAEMAKQGDGAAAQQCAALVDQAIDRARQIAASMRPTVLDDLGLGDALQWALDRQASTAGWSARYESGIGEQRFAREIETACFRIAQEALANCASHSGASEVSVSLDAKDGTLVLVVADNGRGFDVESYRSAQDRSKYIGLVAMEERAGLVGAKLAIESAPGRGTRVTAHFPLTPLP